MMKILTACWSAIIGFLSRLWDGKDHSAEIKLLAYAAAVAATITWLTLALSKNAWKITSEWNLAFLYFLLMVSAGVGIQAWQIRGQDNASKDTSTGKKDEEGK